MGKVKDLERKRITESAGHYLCDQPSGDLYGAYNELKEVQEEGNGLALADNYVVVWQPLNHMTVDQIVELIENGARGNDPEDYPEFIQKMDWSLLRKQKSSLIKTIYDEKKGKGNDAEELLGILHVIDALQDYAVDDLGVDEIKVFGEERGDK